MFPSFFARRTFAPVTIRYYSSTTLLDPSLNFLPLLQLSIEHQSLKLIRHCHAQIISNGCNQNPFLATKLISAYALCGTRNEARLVFDSVQHKSVYLWNSVINGYVKHHAYSEAFDLFNEMYNDNMLPDDFTLATLAKVCSELGDLNAGKLIHGKSIRIGFVFDIVVANSIMAMYCKCAEFIGTRKLFDEMPKRNVGSWNVVIAGYANSEDFNFHMEMWGLVKEMQIEGLKPDPFTISSILPTCGGDVGRWDYGRELHGFILRNELDMGFGSDVHVGCCLIDMYSRRDKVLVGRQVFERLKCRNVYAWTAMINGYVHSGALDEAFVLFREMWSKDGKEPNKVSLVSVLPACSSLAGLMGAKQIHGFAVRKELTCDTSLCNALIDTYAKCGNLNYARQIFNDGSFSRDAISWSSIISGYGLHGKGEEAVFLYDEMLRLGNKPDMITVVGILSACSRSGLVNEGLNIYNAVVNEYGIKPTVEICACAVDLLGRSGQLDQAFSFIKTMPVEPGPSVWGALVHASAMHGNCKMLDLAYSHLIQLEPANPSNYVSLSNLHASSRRWDVVAEVRAMMKERGLRKAPGCSWISINGKIHCFYVADKAHPCSDSIYDMLDSLILLMKGAVDPADFNLT